MPSHRNVSTDPEDAHKSSTTYSCSEYSDTLLLAVLKANNPDKFRDRIEQVNIQDIDIDKLSPEILDKLAEHLINKAMAGKPPEMVEEARKRIEAGETVTIEELERHQLERVNPLESKA